MYSNSQRNTAVSWFCKLCGKGLLNINIQLKYIPSIYIIFIALREERDLSMSIQTEAITLNLYVYVQKRGRTLCSDVYSYVLYTTSSVQWVCSNGGGASGTEIIRKSQRTCLKVHFLRGGQKALFLSLFSV